MLKKELTSHFGATVIWVLVVSLLRLTHGQVWEILFLLLGSLAGTFLLDLDNLFYIYTYSQEPTSQKAVAMIAGRRFKEAFWLLLGTHEERYKLTFHNILFQAGFFILCFYVIVSTGSWFGKGLVMAAALHLLKDEVSLILAGRQEILRQGFFWPLRGEISFYNQKLVVVGMGLVFMVLTLLLV